MLHRIVIEDFRHNTQQAALNTLGIAFAVMILLTVAGAQFKPLGHAYAVTLIFKFTLTSMLLVGLVVDLWFLTINRFTQVREKVHQYAVLRVLGAPPSFFYLLQLQEALLLFVAGTVGGITLTYLVRIVLAHLVPDLLAVESLFGLWPWIGVVPAGAFYAAGVFASDSINGADLVDALSSKE
jgi:hypothetical protein